MNQKSSSSKLFFKQFFSDKAELDCFINKYEPLRPGDDLFRAKIMMNQTRRLVSLSSDIPKIRQDNELLPLLFLLICAENIAKLANNFDEDGQSKVYVRNFFNWFANDQDKNKIIQTIKDHNGAPLSFDNIIDRLYEIRCEAVHEGKYWGFHFHTGNTPMLNHKHELIVAITLTEFRNIVVRGCISAIQQYPHISNKSQANRA